jgi:hypothetical protein
MTDTLDQAFRSWRQLFAVGIDARARWAMMEHAAYDLAGFIAHGADKQDIADKLEQLRVTYMADADVDDVQTIIADAFARAEEEAERVPDNMVQSFGEACARADEALRRKRVGTDAARRRVGQ